jgi:hypothetical protein
MTRNARPPKKIPPTPDPYLRHEDRGLFIVSPLISKNKDNPKTEGGMPKGISKLISNYQI